MDNSNELTQGETQYVIKRSGDKVPFESDKIQNAILKAMMGINKVDAEMAEKISRLTKKSLFRNDKNKVPHVDEVHDMVENKLMDIRTLLKAFSMLSPGSWDLVASLTRMLSIISTLLESTDSATTLPTFLVSPLCFFPGVKALEIF